VHPRDETIARPHHLGGFKYMRTRCPHREYGDYVTGKGIITDETKKEMNKVLTEIQTAVRPATAMETVNRRTSTHCAGRSEHLLEKTGMELRSCIPGPAKTRTEKARFGGLKQRQVFKGAERRRTYSCSTRSESRRGDGAPANRVISAFSEIVPGPRPPGQGRGGVKPGSG
jgi:hypothetical protein